MKSDFKQDDCMIDAGGEEFPLSSLKPWDIPVAMCCPCCLGNPCAPHRREWLFSQLTYFLSGVAILQIFIFLMELGNSELGQLFHLPNPILIQFGARDPLLIKKGQFLRLLVPIFLHAGVLHLFVDVLATVFYGVPLERQWGWRRTAVIFLVSGVAGNLLAAIVNPDTIGVGGATAVFGLIGANVAQLVCGWHLMSGPERRVTSITVTLYFAILTIFSLSFENHIVGHIGGGIGGLLLGFIFFSHLFESSALQQFAPVWSGIALFAFFAAGIGKLFMP